jgi:hypothetical protein
MPSVARAAVIRQQLGVSTPAVPDHRTACRCGCSSHTCTLLGPGSSQSLALRPRQQLRDGRRLRSVGREVEVTQHTASTVDDATLRGGERRNLGCGCARLDGLLQMRSNRRIAHCLQAEPHRLRQRGRDRIGFRRITQRRWVQIGFPTCKQDLRRRKPSVHATDRVPHMGGTAGVEIG